MHGRDILLLAVSFAAYGWNEHSTSIRYIHSENVFEVMSEATAVKTKMTSGGV